MAKSSIAYRLLTQLKFEDLKFICQYYKCPSKKSKEETIAEIIKKTGTGLDILVSREQSPFYIQEWNEVIDRLEGSRRQSFRNIADEFERLLNADESESQNTILKINFASTKVKTVPDIEKLDVAWMKKYFQDADEIAIASGFYDENFIKNKLLKVTKAKKIRLLFNGLGGQRLKQQCESLLELQNILKKRHLEVDIRLFFTAGLFHSKLFLVTKKNTTTAIIGSANATDAAFRLNEEILVSIPNNEAFSTYYEAVWEQGTKLKDANDIKINSLIAFFRTGKLYFKPATSLSTTINPFRDLLKLIPAEELEKLANLPEIPYADKETGIGPFSLKRVIESDEDNKDEPIINTRTSIKPYSIETCFGYWVPEAYDILWQRKLEESNCHKKIKWDDFKDKFESIEKDELFERYEEYINKIMSYLEKIDGLNKFICESLRLENDVKEEKARSEFSEYLKREFNNFYVRTDRFLKNKKRFERLTNSFVSGPIPEMWDDKPAYDEFRDTFFDYLDGVAQSQTINYAVTKSIFEKIGSENINEIQESFELYLKYKGWENKDWI
ncbi:MAG: phospholipase D family protein [Advenella sp.]|uniref:phospholipase D family protein n=1 Tax=Advenella sp. TaxID=1872388 RepID=UPI00258F7B2F|nr:phospholipase D family protein [Advenella sp.]MDD3758569.1 phospholipase D family protein [Advenella sp.]